MQYLDVTTAVPCSSSTVGQVVLNATKLADPRCVTLATRSYCKPQAGSLVLYYQLSSPLEARLLRFIVTYGANPLNGAVLS